MAITSDIYGSVMRGALLEVCQLHVSALGVDGNRKHTASRTHCGTELVSALPAATTGGRTATCPEFASSWTKSSRLTSTLLDSDY